MLKLTRRPRQSIRIGDEITVTVLRAKGNAVKFGFDAPEDVQIDRAEFRERLEQEQPESEEGYSANEIDDIEARHD